MEETTGGKKNFFSVCAMSRGRKVKNGRESFRRYFRNKTKTPQRLNGKFLQ